ncbi:aspartyl-tRNA(Asn)/glutamyl-tRNA(Gln) amidotransferase subunit A [Cupriavidus metallidurans]|jgi:aspartyl-tRNA(Asn)/glutamyl-tRNA(Gln) amidotransferase subunit A|uniref:amidase n=1 Tax=Cupriavidus TaxID=106589 RepID=UPI000492F6BF|nr:amidase [Cupriavidus metallidurans]AVA36049.1 amidase [Cupriavidus metallidurans]KWW37876.1 Mandelamide hydrolase [Cupriavidus metallidurans]MDE4918196.1 amidase [Cupriavidus metallidurans]
MSAPTIAQLAAALAAGRTTSVALTEAALANIARHQQGGGSAFMTVDAEGALAQARAADQARSVGLVASPLAGLPISIKDLFDVRGQVTRAGSKALDGGAPAQADSPAVARLRAAGAVLIGRTNMSEFAFSGLGLNPHYGTPRTPFDPERVAGGSTSGGAVSVAEDMAVAALGTDTGGSIRIPSAFCGLTGFKPTARRVPLDGAVPLSTSLDSAGPLARSVACCVAMDAVLSGETLDTRAADLRGLRFYVTRDFVCDGLDPEVAQTFEAALARLSAQGATIVPFDFPELRRLPEINGGGGLTAAESWAWHRTLLAAKGDQYDQRVAQRIRRGEKQSAADYIDLLAARCAMQQRAAVLLRDADAWLMPTVAVRPPRLDALERDEDFFAVNGLVLRNASVINFLDGCAATLPAGEGIGLGVCGLHGSDARVLQVAAAIERAFD